VARVVGCCEAGALSDAAFHRATSTNGGECGALSAAIRAGSSARTR
jgi:hypothetical protein